jgi:hypothetical protein
MAAEAGSLVRVGKELASSFRFCGWHAAPWRHVVDVIGALAAGTIYRRSARSEGQPACFTGRCAALMGYITRALSNGRCLTQKKLDEANAGPDFPPSLVSLKWSASEIVTALANIPIAKRCG